MFTLGSATQIYLASGVTDLRRGYNGLYALIEHQMQHQPLSGDLYVFANRRRDALKIFYWDGSGMCLWSKRLERGTFRWPEPGASSVTMSLTQLQLLLHGIDLIDTRERAWWRPKIREK